MDYNVANLNNNVYRVLIILDTEIVQKLGLLQKQLVFEDYSECIRNYMFSSVYQIILRRKKKSDKIVHVSQTQ